MKKLLLLLLCVPLLTLAQNTYVPDDNFEQELIHLGYDNVLDDYVTTANIDTITHLDVDGNDISDLTGIEDFISLKFLTCHSNDLTSLDVSNNTNLEVLVCLENYIICLDISANTALEELYCESNLLEQLNTRNGNWQNMTVIADDNNLTCVEVDNIGQATNSWTFDGFTTISTNCNYVNPCATVSKIQEYTSNKKLLKITDILGREVNEKRNTPLFYIYNDGTVEKRIVIK